MTPSTPTPTVVLTGAVTKAGDRTVIEYQLANQRKQPIYVEDLMVNYGKDGPFLDPDLAYVCFEEPRTVRVVRAVLPMPVGMKINSKEIPYARKVAAGKTIKGRISLATPVKEYSPFFITIQDNKEPRKTPCDTVRLIVGFSEEREGMEILERDVGGQPVLALRGGWVPYQELAEAKWKYTVDLLVRQDTFDRRMPQT